MKWIAAPLNADLREKLPFFLANATLLMAGYGIGTIVADLSSLLA